LGVTRYGPNIWKVFLMYAQDLSAKVPGLNLPFPEAAKISERFNYKLIISLFNLITNFHYFGRVLFGVPFGAPFKKSDLEEASASGSVNDLLDAGYIMTEKACLKFAKVI
jgi:hypothetical protein